MGTSRLTKKSRQGMGFTVLQNAALNDPRLSLKAIGLHAVLMSYPEGTVFSIEKLSNRLCQNGKTSIRAAIKELEQNGYYERVRYRNENNEWAWQTTVYDLPPDYEDLISKNISTITKPNDPKPNDPKQDVSKQDDSNPDDNIKDLDNQRIYLSKDLDKSKTDQDIVVSKKTTKKGKVKHKYSEQFDSWWDDYRGFCLYVSCGAGEKIKAYRQWQNCLEETDIEDFLEATEYYILTKTAQFKSKGEAEAVSHGERFISTDKWREALDHKRGQFKTPESSGPPQDDRYKKLAQLMGEE